MNNSSILNRNMEGYDHIQEAEHEWKVARMKQRLAGALAVAIGLVSIPVLNMDATAAVLFVPSGLYLLLSSKVYIGY